MGLSGYSICFTCLIGVYSLCLSRRAIRTHFSTNANPWLWAESSAAVTDDWSLFLYRILFRSFWPKPWMCRPGEGRSCTQKEHAECSPRKHRRRSFYNLARQHLPAFIRIHHSQNALPVTHRPPLLYKSSLSPFQHLINLHQPNNFRISPICNHRLLD
jgi:hypothetical protein